LLAAAAAWSANGAASTPAAKYTGTWFTGGSATTTKPQVLLEPAGTTSTGWSTAGTGLGINAPSGFTGNLLDVQVNGSSKAFISYQGLISGDYAKVGSLATEINLNYYQGGVGVSSTGQFTFGTGASASGYDVALARDAANTLAQRNSTNAQQFNIYNTYTDASNNEFVRFIWSSSKFYIQTRANGTGGVRELHFGVAGDHWYIPTGGHWLAGLDNTYDIGANGATRPRNGYFAGILSIGGGTQGRVAAIDGSGNSFARMDAGNSGGTTGVHVAANSFLGFTSASNNALTTVDTTFARVAAGIVKLTNNSTGAGVMVLQAVTVTSLPSAATAGVGALATVTDANATTARSTVAGGGANKVLVMSDGTNWIIMG